MSDKNLSEIRELYYDAKIKIEKILDDLIIQTGVSVNAIEVETNFVPPKDGKPFTFKYNISLTSKI